ncbi:hypothetical protein AB0D62_13630 [Streptomyces massasporeus]|uniref:hypothetical protein n=1 Tax=Streptomyces massasporeus TaxID=67324 RepID=UPI0033FAB7D6
MARAQQTQQTQIVDPFAAAESLRAALDEVGIVLPSLRGDAASPHLGLVALGRVRADIAMRLAEVLRRGGRG